MSVVNKMLKDLDKREQQTDGQYVSNYQPGSAHSSRIVWPIIVLVLVCIIGYLVVFNAPSADTTESIPKTLVASPEGEAKPLLEVASAPSEVAKVTSPVAELVSSKQADQNYGNETSSVDEGIADGTHERDGIDKIVHQDSPTPDEVMEVVADEAIPEEIESKSQDTVEEVASEAPIVEEPVAVFTKQTSRTNTIEELQNQAQKALNRGDRIAAEDFLTQIVQRQPQSIKARKKLASIMFAHGKQEVAKQVLNEGLAIDPNREDIRLMLSRMWLRQQNTEQALSLLTRHSGAITNFEFLVSRASLAQKMSRFEQSKSDYSLLVRRQPENAKWWLGLAISQDKLGEFKAALISYKRAENANQLAPEVVNFVKQRIYTLTETS